MQYKLSNDLASVGSNYIEIFPDPGEDRNSSLQKMPELTVGDAEAVKKSSPMIKEFTPMFMNNVDTKFGGTTHRVQMYGVDATYQDIFNHWVEHGRFFSPVDSESKKRIIVVGASVIENLNIPGDPLGKQIQVDGRTFTIIGIMEKKGGSFGQDRDDLVLIPFETAAAIYGSENMKRLVLAFQMREGTDLDLVKDQIKEVLRTRHHIPKGKRDDFRMLAQEEILKIISGALMTTSVVMGAVVGIALLVGGIGIMNIMLVSVTERTREIGIRKSIGARRRDVLVQFLVEAIALSGLGGLIGVSGGFLLANLTQFSLNRFFPKLNLPPAHTPLWAILLAFGFCAFLGVVFGIYPAAKASKLDPIEALRYE